jgi:NAD(P)-dependent dehydrogenase (short-subunit alcohol dehydrogenase family)
MPSIFITGANRGLGLEFARQYAADGWTVVATCRDPSNATELKALDVEIIGLDVGDFTAIAGLRERLAGRHFDILLNNAGIYGDRLAFGELDAASWEQVLKINAIAPLKLAEALLPQLLAGQRKLMVFITSMMGSVAQNSGGGSYAYRSSKSALNAAVKSLSIDLAPQGVAALLLHPGWVKTDMGGANAAVEIKDSIVGMRRVIAQTKPGESLKFLDYQGTALPW